MAFRLTLAGRDIAAPAGAVIGLIGEDPAEFGPAVAAAQQAQDFVVNQPFLSPLARLRLTVEMEQKRRAGVTVLIASADESLLMTCDELWWLEGRELLRKGHPAEIIPMWQRAAFQTFRQTADSATPIPPLFRRGDGRAQLLSITPCDETDQPSATWQTAHLASVIVRVRFAAPVDDPVIGIMIRTHMGMEVYGTNTELERLRIGPVRAGDTRDICFRFLCRLCPQMYVVTAASHDPDGVWHDWVEDAVAVTVGDTRYTAGVVNLEAQVTVSPA